MSDEPKLSRSNDDGWQPLTGWAAVKLCALIVGLCMLLCGITAYLFQFFFGG